MARPRTELQTVLEEVLGSKNVYYQPPENLKMEYPAIVYERNRTWDIFADNMHYLRYKGYQITYIDWNPDSPTLDRIENLPMCSYDRHAEFENLNHDYYIIYF